MEKAIVLRLDGENQSWPVSDSPMDSACYEIPTKHGVLRSIIAAAQGRDPGADISDLMRAITFGVAVVQIGYMVDSVEFIGPVHGPENCISVPVITDGIFYVGLSCEMVLAEELLLQLQHPKNPLSYGRKVFPVAEGALAAYLSDDPLEQALIKAACNDPARRIRVEVEVDNAVEIKHHPHKD